MGKLLKCPVSESCNWVKQHACPHSGEHAIMPSCGNECPHHAQAVCQEVDQKRYPESKGFKKTS